MSFDQPVFNAAKGDFDSEDTNLLDNTFDLVYASTNMASKQDGYLWGMGMAGTLPTIPRDHFLGVSSPCATVADARNEAFWDVAKQIVRTIGGRYDMQFQSRMTQDGDNFRQYVDERFRFSAKGFMAEIESNIVSSRYTEADGG
jgi:hypothetical protein